MTEKDLDVIIERAAVRFRSGFNCAEAVYLAGAEILGKDATPSVMTGFGGGISRQNLLCGALTGGIVAIGLACGRTEGTDRETKDRAYRMVGEFVSKFKDLFDSEYCEKLCGYNLSDPEGVALFMKNDTHNQVCSRYVLEAIRLLSKILND
jgi:C_GCAxxG_C_C family probable redox protein